MNISAFDEIKKLEKQKKSLEKLLELENDMKEKEQEYIKAKDKYEISIKKIYGDKSSDNKEASHE